MAFFSFLFFSVVRCLCQLNALLSAYRLRFCLLNSRIRLFCMQKGVREIPGSFFILYHHSVNHKGIRFPTFAARLLSPVYSATTDT